MNKARAYVCKVLVVVPFMGGLFFTSGAVAAEASQGSDGCSPFRTASTSVDNFDGWQTQNNAGVGGATVQVNTYSPYVENYGTQTLTDAWGTSVWSMVDDTGNGDLAQVGYAEMYNNTGGGNGTSGSERVFFTEFEGTIRQVTPAPGTTLPSTPYLENQYIYNTIYNRDGAGAFDFYIGDPTHTAQRVYYSGSQMALSYDSNFAPNNAQIYGEVKTVNDQMPGDPSNQLQLTNAGLYFSSNWQPMDQGSLVTTKGAFSNTGSLDNWYQSYEVSTNHLNVWDQCSAPPAADFYSENSQQSIYWQDIQSDTVPGGLAQGAYTTGWAGEGHPSSGTIGSPPTAINDTNQQQEVVFWKGTDNGLWENYYNGTSWNSTCPCPVTATSSHAYQMATAPVAIYDSHQQQQVVFWKGGDGNLYSMHWHSGTGWTAVSEITNTSGGHMGPLGSGPTAAFDSHSNQQVVFWKGTNSLLWETYWISGTGWSAAASVSGTNNTIYSQPSAGFDSRQNQQIIFWQGTSSSSYKLQEIYYTDGSGWSGESTVSLPTQESMDSAPSVTFDTANSQQLIFWKKGGALHEAWWDPTYLWQGYGSTGSYSDLG